jgi:hypothetical protein
MSAKGVGRRLRCPALLASRQIGSQRNGNGTDVIGIEATSGVVLSIPAGMILTDTSGSRSRVCVIHPSHLLV